AQRQKKLQWVINNARFLVLPWIECKGLASKILSLAARRIPNDWLSRYGLRPVLLETFVEYERHKGTCYKAANWIKVGRTAGRGKKSTSHKPLIPAKDIWLYPLRENFATFLCK
ncbi:Druantia anti-phage system protein DruA, partial [Devosia sp.]|uniref:Druantia anti-phage system protein DruA n=1 Tax=Devosia sp. TaxID=1871048 RepID=UPI0027340166